MNATDFFNKVFFAFDVNAPGGGLNFDRIGGDAEDVESEFFEVGFGLFCGDGHAEKGTCAAQVEGEGELFGLGWIDINDAANGPDSGDFFVQFGESVEGGDGEFGIHGSFESVACFGEESEFRPGLANGGVGEVGSFEQAPGGCGGDFGF